MAKINGDTDPIQRDLREISGIQDGRIVKALKNVLQRQVRIYERLERMEASVESLRRGLKAAGDKPD